MYAMNVARFQRFPESRQQGSRALPRLVLFASEEVGTVMVTGGGGSGSSTLSPLPAVPTVPLLHPERSRLPRHRHRQRRPGACRREVGVLGSHQVNAGIALGPTALLLTPVPLRPSGGR